MHETYKKEWKKWKKNTINVFFVISHVKLQINAEISRQN